MSVEITQEQDTKSRQSFLTRFVQLIYERDKLHAILIGVICGLVYLSNGSFSYQSGDTVPAALLPFSITFHHDFFLGRYFSSAFLHSSQYFLVPSHGGYVSYASSIGSSITVLPVYFLYHILGGTASVGTGAIMGKLSASLVSSVSVAILYLLLRKLEIRAWISILFTVLYGFGSETFAVSSQALWRHGPAELWFTVFLFSTIHILSNPKQSVISSQFAGLAMGMLFFCRPQNLILVLPFAILAVKKDYRSPILQSLPLFVLIVAGAEWYKFVFYHQGTVSTRFPTKLSTTLSNAVSNRGLTHVLNGSLKRGLLGNLISPSRGLFVFMPWTVFSVFWLRFVRRRFRWRVFYFLITVSLLLYLYLYSKIPYWSAGYSFGGRYLTEALPGVTILTAGYFEMTMRYLGENRWPIGVRNGCLIVLGIWSVAIQFLGVDVPSGANWNLAVDAPSFPSTMWSVKDNEISYYLRSWRASMAPPIMVRDPKVTFREFSVSGVAATDGITKLLPHHEYNGTIKVTNNGKTIWPAYAAKNGNGAVHLVYSVWRNGKKIAVTQPEALPPFLLRSVKAGQSETIYLYLYTPARPGHYIYVFTLAQDGYGKFGQGLNSPNNTLQVPVTVVS